MTSSRQRARPMATRSLIWRTLGNRLPAARTGADRSASNRRAIDRTGAGRVGWRPLDRSMGTAKGYERVADVCKRACEFFEARRPGAYAAHDELIGLRLSWAGVPVRWHGSRPGRSLARG